MNGMFLDVRKPLFKAVSHETIDKSSQLYSMYLRKELTPQLVCESGENPFVAAFIYNELYDIKEYLLHVRDMEITNQTYNIIKHYLRRQDKVFIMEYFNSPSHSNRHILRVLKGEIYRICKYDPDCFDEYFFAGHVSIGDVLLPCFENVFSAFVARNPRIIDMLDVSSQRVRRAALACIGSIVDYLDDSNLLEPFLEELNFDVLSVDQIVRILSNKSLEKTRVPSLMAKVENVIKLFDVIQKGGPEIYLCSRGLAMERISCSDVPIECITNYFYLMLFYDPGAFDSDMVRSYSKGYEHLEPFKILLKTPGVDIDKARLYDRIRDACFETDAPGTIELFARFLYLLSFQVPDLEDILNFPEKFFSYGLGSIGTPDARNLKIFNDNMLNERLRRHVSANIDRGIFIKYLITRHKLFDIELDGYEDMMDERYKLMYAHHNLRWASKNIEILDKIGITDRLYRSLSNSPFKDCLTRAVNTISRRDVRVSCKAMKGIK